MKTLTKKEFLKRKEEYIQKIREGAVFLYPTDTIYGIGCNAKKAESVKKIRKAKEREKEPFSVIAPSKEWIKQNCKVPKKYLHFLEKLPGAYTLILPMKKRCVSMETTRKGLGVRMPDHWITEAVKEAGVPIVTTSINKKGERPAQTLKKIPQQIKREADFAIDEGMLEGKPSTLIILTGKKAEIIKRK